MREMRVVMVLVGLTLTAAWSAVQMIRPVMAVLEVARWSYA